MIGAISFQESFSNLRWRDSQGLRARVGSALPFVRTTIWTPALRRSSMPPVTFIMNTSARFPLPIALSDDVVCNRFFSTRIGGVTELLCGRVRRVYRKFVVQKKETL